ncbi:unnamed protein product [Rotaria socialis]|uniref:2',3'-cyclic-nucleotide 3'-phosphodiesterase n=1 Tax=Rotaria socialis TaxID=392032 RepID=A0A818B1X3_9BILA|nr:unnamed protein product [Rotaria socialis]CAF4160360.1 unnamed protein product [Rotaria socialis]
MGYSLWLLPPSNSKIASSLISAIKCLGCSFAPHITLTSKISLSISVENIKASLNLYFAKNSLPTIHINTLDTGSQFFKRIFLRCEKTDSLVSLARFSKQAYIGNNEDTDDDWTNDYDPHISLIYAEKQNCNDQELISRIDTSTLIDKTWQGGKIQLVDTTGELSEWKTVLEFDIPNSD